MIFFLGGGWKYGVHTILISFRSCLWAIEKTIFSFFQISFLLSVPWDLTLALLTCQPWERQSPRGLSSRPPREQPGTEGWSPPKTVTEDRAGAAVRGKWRRLGWVRFELQLCYLIHSGWPWEIDFSLWFSYFKLWMIVCLKCPVWWSVTIIIVVVIIITKKLQESTSLHRNIGGHVLCFIKATSKAQRCFQSFI